MSAAIESHTSEHDSVRLELTMRGGAQVQSWFSCRTATSDWLEFAGEGATLRADRHRAGVSLRVPRRFGYGMRSARVAPTPEMAEWWMRRLARPSNEPSYRRALTAFIGALRGEAVSVPTLDDGMRALEVVEAAEQSARSGAPVDVRTASRAVQGDSRASGGVAARRV